MISNSNGEYLKAHAEAETEEALLPYKNLPEYRAFKARWDIVVDRMKDSGITPTQSERNIAENWFCWGYTTGRLIT